MAETLLSLTTDHLLLMETIKDAEFNMEDPEVIEALKVIAAGLGEDQARKLESYRRLIVMFEMDEACLATEAASLLKMRDQRSRAIEHLMATIKAHMIMRKEKRAMCESLHYFLLKGNGGKAPLVINDGIKPDSVPERFQKRKIEFDNDAIRAGIAAGDPEAMAIATLKERGTHVEIV